VKGDGSLAEKGSRPCGPGVPLFVIGNRVLTGLQDRETLEAAIEEEQKRPALHRKCWALERREGARHLAEWRSHALPCPKF
jgi:hypothetical protein